MLNEKRVKHMVKLASYEAKNGAEEIKVNSFFQKDYVSYNVLITLLWITLGYLSFAGLLCLGFLKEILANLSFSNIVILIVAIVAGYIFTLILYCVGAVRFYKKKHHAARNGVKKHVRDLEILERMYEREEA